MAYLKDVQGVIWDLDGTLYRFSELFKTACNHAAAKAACTVRPHYIYEEAFAKCVASEQECGFSLFWFHQETGMALKDMHFVYHDAIDETVIEKNEKVVMALRSLKLPSLILTNSSQGWAARILKHLNMDGIFGDGDIIALEDTNFQPKRKGDTGFKMAVARLGLRPENILVVEDLPSNLAKAKEIGLKTMLLHHGKVPEDQGLADFLCHDVLEALSLLKENQGRDNYSAS